MKSDIDPKSNGDHEIKVFITSKPSTCGDCGEELGKGCWITLAGEKGCLCLSCADLDHLLFLPSGDAALTRRSKKYSTLYAVVLKWSRARKRYERQGLLIESEALDKAEQECLADEDVRARRREREVVRRQEEDRQYIEQFAQRVKEVFPGCPTNTGKKIAEHACQKYSGRVGRSAFAKALDEKAVRLAVAAHVRHAETNYDRMLGEGLERWEARENVKIQVDRVLERWEETR